MLSFVAEFPIDADREPQDFLRAVKQWIIGSPHTAFTEFDLDNIQPVGEYSAVTSSQQLYTLCASSAAQISSFRLTNVERDLSWVTEVVFSRDRANTWVGVRTSRESFQPALRLPEARKPVIVRTLLDLLGGGYDGELKVLASPHGLLDVDLERATRLIFGDAGCRLPLVYVSASFSGEAAIDAAALANDLAGMAHVVVEPNRSFSVRLQVNVDSENVYGGAVGIYWPDSAGRRSYFLTRDFDHASDMKKAIVAEVRLALLNRRPLQRCTFSAAREAHSRATLETLRQSGSVEVEKYAKAFDGEIQAKEQQLKDAEAEISRLQSEVRRVDTRRSVGVGVNLSSGGERDYFAGEMGDIVVDALTSAANAAQDGSRRQDVLRTIAASNVKANLADGFREKLKETLRDYTRMSKSTSDALASLGFDITEEGKHFKLKFHGDDRYTFSLPKSGSDHRGGLNAASDINKRVF